MSGLSGSTGKDPVSMPCGHTYCWGCSKSYWDQKDGIGIYAQ